MGRNLLGHALEVSLEARLPLELVLPAFPCKSANTRDKVLGTLPDRGEELALQTLERLRKSIAYAHPFGCNLTIVTDGHVFADLVGVHDDTVSAYATSLEAMLPHGIRAQGLGTWYAGRAQEKRDALIDEYGLSRSTVHDCILADPARMRMYLGLRRFLLEDRIWPANMSNGARTRAVREAALEMVRRNDAYSRLIADRFPRAVRLSIHPHDNVEKIGIALVSGRDDWGTPWHNVVVEYGTHAELMRRSAAERAGYALVEREGRPWCFRPER